MGSGLIRWVRRGATVSRAAARSRDRSPQPRRDTPRPARRAPGRGPGRPVRGSLDERSRLVVVWDVLGLIRVVLDPEDEPSRAADNLRHHDGQGGVRGLWTRTPTVNARSTRPSRNGSHGRSRRRRCRPGRWLVSVSASLRSRRYPRRRAARGSARWVAGCCPRPQPTSSTERIGYSASRRVQNSTRLSRRTRLALAYGVAEGAGPEVARVGSLPRKATTSGIARGLVRMVLERRGSGDLRHHCSRQRWARVDVR